MIALVARDPVFIGRERPHIFISRGDRRKYTYFADVIKIRFPIIIINNLSIFIVNLYI